MIDRIHNDSANGGPFPPPAVGAGFPKGYVFVIRITYHPDGGAAINMYLSDLTGRQPYLGVVPFFGYELSGCSGPADQLSALAKIHLYIMNGCTNRDVDQRKVIAPDDICLGTGNDGVSDFCSRGADYIPFFAVVVVQPGQMSISIRIIFDRRDCSRDSVLDPLEINHPVKPFVASPSSTNSDSALAVPGTDSLLALG